MYWGMNDWTSPLKSPTIYKSWLKVHAIQYSFFSLLISSIRCIWPQPPSYTLFPLVPISLYSCFLLLSFANSSSSTWSLDDDPQDSDLHASFAFALLCLTHSLQESTFSPTKTKFLSPLQIFFSLPDQLLYACPPGCLTPSSPSYLVLFHIIVNMPSKLRQKLQNCFGHCLSSPPIPSHMHHLVHYQFPSILHPKLLPDPPLSPHLHYYCLSLASLLSLLDF